MLHLLFGKGLFHMRKNVKYTNSNTMVREDIIRHIVKVSGEDPIVSTTGKQVGNY